MKQGSDSKEMHDKKADHEKMEEESNDGKKKNVRSQKRRQLTSDAKM